MRRRWAGPLVVAMSLVAACTTTTYGGGGGGEPPPPQSSAGFVLEPVIEGLVAPTNLEFTSDGRVVVTEKPGTVKVFDSLADPTPTLMVDLRDPVFSWGDFGMLGLETHPDFAANPFVYLFYSHDFDRRFNDDCSVGTLPSVPGCHVDGQLVRYEIGPDQLPVGPPTVLEEGRFCGNFDHAGADLEFLPDGTLALSIGDGASPQGIDYGQQPTFNFDHLANPCLDPPSPANVPLSAPTSEGGALRSQDLLTPDDPTSFDGTVIRIDPATGDAPADNPLVGNAVADDDEIIAHGLRNPFRMTARPGTDELWLGDVGWGTWEEINRIPDPADAVVENFGWPCYEGDDRQSVYDLADLDLCEGLYAGNHDTDLTGPWWAYRHGQAPDPTRCGVGGGSSISLLAFNEATGYPARLDDALFFGDYVRGCIWALRAGAGGLPDPTAVETIVSGVRPVDLEFGPDGNGYYLDIAQGAVVRLEYRSGSQPPIADLAVDPDNGAVPLSVAFDGTGSSDPEGGGLDYAWDLDGDGALDDSTSATPSFLYTTPGDVTVTLRVTDGDGLTDTETVTVHAGNTRPTGAVSDPGSWSTGETLVLTATGTDAEDGPLPPAAFDWEVLLEHCSSPTDCHLHGLTTATGTDQVTVVGPNHEWPAYVLVRLTVTDSGGLATTVERRLDPETVQVDLTSTPPGIEVGVGESVVVTPGSDTAVRNSQLPVVAPASVEVDGTTYVFESWSDGGERVHDVQFVAPTSLHATYAAAP